MTFVIPILIEVSDEDATPDTEDSLLLSVVEDERVLSAVSLRPRPVDQPAAATA